ncbi:MAG: uracil-DNA glycosylase [Promethearchaeota archaeon]
MAAPEWTKIRQEILDCQKCRLAESRTQAVPGVGPQSAQLVIIGEAPGRHEDLQGEPFVGAAGKLLTKLLEEAGIPRSSVFITNIVKCRPPENRQPLADERRACYPYLIRQLDLIQPKIIALVGRVPAETILETTVRMGAMHGKTFHHGGRTYIVMYHPAAGLYNQDLVSELQVDMQKLKQVLDSGDQSKPESGQQDLSKFFEKK